ncbi:MAG: putative quinol monooxygenase [Verrucomicrobiales bacterium]
MSCPPNTVTIHPYFKVHPGKMDLVRALLRRFVATTQSEPGCLFYEFTLNGDEVFCREGYVGADGVQAHLANVGGLLDEMLTLSDLTRLEFHGPGGELDKLREPMAAFNAAWFVSECGVTR